MASRAARGVRGPQTGERHLNAATVGITLVVCTLIGLAGGYYADQWLGTWPWFAMIGLALGIAAGFVNLFRSTKR